MENLKESFRKYVALKHAVSEDMTTDEMLDVLTSQKRYLSAIQLHRYEIHHTAKSGYFTYVDDDTAPNGRRFIRKAHKKQLLDELVAWYVDHTGNNGRLTLTDIYGQWIKWKATPNNVSNIKRIKAEWNAYYLNEPLTEELLSKPFVKITDLDLRDWAESLLRKHLPDKIKYYRIFLIINNCYEFAVDPYRKIVTTNLWVQAKKTINPALIKRRKNYESDTQVFTETEHCKLKDMIYDDLKRYKKQSSSAGLQILFLIQTGIRIGECCGLMWSDIRGEYIYISRQANNDGVIDHTKTEKGTRIVPLTDEAKKILADIKAFNEEHGYNAEWVFQSGNPKYDNRLSYNAADRKLRRLCDRIGTKRKSPHKCRKTYISALIDAGVSPRTVQQLVGHEELSTTLNNYYYDRDYDDDLFQKINKALSIA